MKLHNTLTKQTEDFKPSKAPQVSIYSCGPTVYDRAHIGNLRYFVSVDSLHRTMAVSGLEVKHTINLTDIDDKTIAASQRDYGDDAPEIALAKLTKLYEELFFEDSKKIGINLESLNFIKATDSIEQIQVLIKKLIEHKFAYIADDGIYFSIEAYKNSGKIYGQLSKINSANTSRARITNDEYDKQSVHDFALWKLQKDDEPAWPFVIDGKDYLGRPGWHIECSAMSEVSLGIPFDIHTAGVDLIFPHNENEIAQSTAASKYASYANYFVHSEHLLIDDRKMSKSLGNFVTVADVEQRGFDPLTLRLLFLQSHYRTLANFTWELMEAAQTRLNGLRNFASLRWQTRKSAPKIKAKIDELAYSLKEAMYNDLDTPKALALISILQNLSENGGIRPTDESDFVKLLELIDKLLGLDLTKQPDISKEQKSVIDQRDGFRKSKDWAKSDQLRDQLSEEGIGLRDYDNSQIWYRLR